jgi:multidrug efflux pump subunit AcrB
MRSMSVILYWGSIEKTIHRDEAIGGLASYGFSRTLTPITIGLLLKNERHGAEAGTGWFARLFAKFERGFETMRNGYTDVLHMLLTRRLIVPAAAVVVLALGGTLFMFVGRDFFPVIDGGQIQLHVPLSIGEGQNIHRLSCVAIRPFASDQARCADRNSGVQAPSGLRAAS